MLKTRGDCRTYAGCPVEDHRARTKSRSIRARHPNARTELLLRPSGSFPCGHTVMAAFDVFGTALPRPEPMKDIIADLHGRSTRNAALS